MYYGVKNMKYSHKIYVEDLHTKNYKALLKEIKDLTKWRDIPWSWIRRFKIIKMWIPPSN